MTVQSLAEVARKITKVRIYDEGFRSCLAVRRNVIGLVQISLVEVGSSGSGTR